MWTPFVNWLLPNYPGCMILVAVIAITVIIVNRYHHWKDRFEKAEKECAKIKEEVLPALSKLDSSVLGLSKSVNGLIIYLKGKDNKMEASLFQSYSSINLTPAGIAILEILEGKKIVDEYTEEMFKEMDTQKVSTALDVQNYAPIVIANFSSREKFTNAKNYIFNHPVFKFNKEDQEFTIPLDLNTLHTVFGIYLRDQYLNAHPEIAPDAETKDDGLNFILI